MDEVQDNKNKKTFVRDIYDIFFFRAFKAPPAIWKFIRSWSHAMFKPGALNPREECGPGKRYLSDVRLTETLFSLTLASAVGNFMLQDLEKGAGAEGPKWMLQFSKYFIGYFQNAYLLWLFSSVLVAAIFVERWWLRLSKSEILPPRELATLFVYEAGVLILPLIAMLFVSGYKLYDPVSQEMWSAFLVYAVFAGIHVIIFFYRIGTRAGFSIRRRIWTSLLFTYLVVFAWLPGVLITMPFYILPLLLLLYPVYAALRDFLPKPAFVRTFFDKIQRALDVK